MGQCGSSEQAEPQQEQNTAAQKSSGEAKSAKAEPASSGGGGKAAAKPKPAEEKQEPKSGDRAGPAEEQPAVEEKEPDEPAADSGDGDGDADEPATEEPADDDVPAEEEKPVIAQRPSVQAREPPASKSIVISERPFGFGAMNGPQFIGAQITSIKNTARWKNPDNPDQYLKSGLFISTIESSSANDGQGGVEDVRYVAWRQISQKLKKYELPITFEFWSGPEIEQACEVAFKDADISPDGHITWDEFQAYTSIIGEELQIDEHLLHEEFDKYAKDEDGKVLDYLNVDTFKLAIAALSNDWEAHPDNPNATRDRIQEGYAERQE